MLVMLNAFVPVLVTIAFSIALWPISTRPNPSTLGTILTVPAVTVIGPLTDTLVSATKVAMMFTVAFAGTVAGAV